MAEAKLFTREEIKSRNTKRDAVLVIHNVVYDVTAFLDTHPGGEEVLLEKVGQDGSESFEDIGHSSDAREMMKQYKIGELVEADRVEVKRRTHAWSSEDGEQAQEGGGLRSWLVPLVLGILATVVYRVLFD